MVCHVLNTVEPQFNEPLYNQVLGITNDFPGPSNSKIYGKEQYDKALIHQSLEHILPVPWPRSISRFHCKRKMLQPGQV